MAAPLKSDLDPTTFVDNPDAMAWAEEFAGRVKAGQFDPTDTGTLVSWFASAMGCGERNASATRTYHAQLLRDIGVTPTA